jgi:hypothetical protein
VELVEANPEPLPGGQHQLGEQRSAIGVEQPVQGPTKAVIAQMRHLLGADAEHAVGKAVHGLLLTVDRFALDDDRSQQHAQRAGVADGATRVRCDVAREYVVQAQALDEVVDERQRAQALGVKREASPLRSGGRGL